ncbi:unnamed protein product, partial [Iphiclides podalirius]
MVNSYGADARTASLSGKQLQSLKWEGGMRFALSASKAKVGLQGKGEREGALPLDRSQPLSLTSSAATKHHNNPLYPRSNGSLLTRPQRQTMVLSTDSTMRESRPRTAPTSQLASLHFIALAIGAEGMGGLASRRGPLGRAFWRRLAARPALSCERRRLWHGAARRRDSRYLTEWPTPPAPLLGGSVRHLTRARIAITDP